MRKSPLGLSPTLVSRPLQLWVRTFRSLTSGFEIVGSPLTQVGGEGGMRLQRCGKGKESKKARSEEIKGGNKELKKEGKYKREKDVQAPRGSQVHRQLIPLH